MKRYPNEILLALAALIIAIGCLAIPLTHVATFIDGSSPPSTDRGNEFLQPSNIASAVMLIVAFASTIFAARSIAMSVSSLLRLLVYGLGGAIIGWFIGFVGGCGYSASLVTEPDPPNFGVIIVALFVALWAGSVGFIIGVYLFARKRSPIGTSKGEDVNVPPNHDHRP